MSKLIKLVVATGVGFVAGILLAPKSGAETRRTLKYEALEAKDHAEELVDEAKQNARRGVDTVKAKASKLKNKTNQ